MNLVAGVGGDGHHGIAACRNLCAGKQLSVAMGACGNRHREGVAHQLIFPHLFHHGVVHTEVAAVDGDGQSVVGIFLGVGHINGPHPGRHLAVGAQVGGVQKGGSHRFTVQGEGKGAIDIGGAGLSHGGDAGIQLHAGAVEVEGVGGAVLVGASEAQVLILGVLDVLHPAVGLIAVHVESIVVVAHGLTGDGAGIVSEVVLLGVIGGALIHIHLYGIRLLAVFLHQLSGEQARVCDLGAVNARLVSVDLLNGESMDALFQAVKDQALGAVGAGFPLGGVDPGIGDGGSDVLGLVGAQQQFYLGAVEGEGGLGALPIGEVAVIFQGVLLHGAAVGLGFPIGPQIIIGEPEQAGAQGVVVDGDGGGLLIVRSGESQFHIVDGGQALSLDGQTNGGGGLRDAAGAAPHALVFGQGTQIVPLAIVTQIGGGHGLDGVALFHHGDLTQQAGIEGVLQGVALAFLLGLPIGLGVTVKGEGGVSALALGVGLGGGVGGPEVQVGLAATQGDGEAAGIVQGDLLELAVVVLVHLVESIARVHKAGVSGDGDLLAGVVGRAGLPLGDVELIVALSGACYQAIHDHKGFGGGGAGKILRDLTLVQAGQGVEVAQHHVAGLAVVGVR